MWIDNMLQYFALSFEKKKKFNKQVRLFWYFIRNHCSLLFITLFVVHLYAYALYYNMYILTWKYVNINTLNPWSIYTGKKIIPFQSEPIKNYVNISRK